MLAESLARATHRGEKVVDDLLGFAHAHTLPADVWLVEDDPPGGFASAVDANVIDVRVEACAGRELREPPEVLETGVPVVVAASIAATFGPERGVRQNASCVLTALAAPDSELPDVCVGRRLRACHP